MGQRLIKGNSYHVPEQVRALKEEYGKLKHVTVFFDNSNFIITKYKPLSNAVHMILEFDNQEELHIESANCGYGGAGPNASVDTLKILGLDKKKVSDLIFYNRAVSFEVVNNQIYVPDTSFLICNSNSYDEKEKGMRNKIVIDANVSINLERRKITIYNPQRTCWVGFLNLLDYMGDIQMEYYIGANSPLEGGFYVGERFADNFKYHNRELDLSGTKHVNLVLSGEHFEIVCLIDKKVEVQVIEAVYLALTGECLFEDNRYTFGKRSTIKDFLVWISKRNDTEIHEIVQITRKAARK